MTGGQIALIILAVAVLLLVLFIGLFLVKLTQTLGVVTNDVDIIAREANDILANVDVLLNDVNGKVATVDPAFQAIADLGTSVSELNDATHNLTDKVKSSSGSNKTKVASAVFAANAARKNRKSAKKAAAAEK